MIAVISSIFGAVVPGASAVWFLALAVWLLSPVAAIVVGMTKGGRAAAGVLAGFGVGILSLAITCFINLDSL